MPFGVPKLLLVKQTTTTKQGDLVVNDPHWREKANCRGADIAEFEVTRDVVASAVVYHAVSQYCLGCPVRTDCVIEAIIADDDGGLIRGGIIFSKSRNRRTPLINRCRKCKLNVAPKGKHLCQFCVLIRECKRCGNEFAARHAWLKESHCPECRVKEVTENRKKSA